MLFGKKALKGTRGVFAAKDVDRYLEDILDLERKVRQRELQVTQLEVRLGAVTRDVQSYHKQIEKQELTIQDQRNEIAEVRIILDDVQTKYSAISQEKATSMEKLKMDLQNAPPRDEFDALKDAKTKLERRVKELERTLDQRDEQLRKLTTDNLQLKDKLKFLRKGS